MFEVGFETSEWANQSKLHCVFEKSMKSTNEVAKELAFSIESQKHMISLVTCNHQTEGRGRGENSWTDPKSGTTLACSWIFEVPKTPKPVTSCRIGIAVEKALSATWPWLEFSMKAPNDIYLESKKVAGLLIENIQHGNQNKLVIGLGLNVWAHPENLNATSLSECIKNPLKLTRVEWNHFLDRLLLELTLSIAHSQESLSVNEQKSVLYMLNKNPNLEKKYTNLDSDGNLFTDSKKINWFDL